MQTYCERCGPGLFDEPLNAVSNVVFLLAAAAALRLARRMHIRSIGLLILMGLSVCIGIGSALWHTFAARWALVLDVVPILSFQLCFFWLYGRFVARLNATTVVVVLLSYVALGFWLQQEYRAWLNGAVIYAPALALTWCVGLHYCVRARRERYLLVAAAVAFFLALACRTIDLIVCRGLPIGTHFLWHVLNGLVAYLAMRTLIGKWEEDQLRVVEASTRAVVGQ